MSDPGGYYEDPNALGMALGMQKTWHSTNGQPDLYGDDAVNKADQVFGGPPTDGITGEKGYHGEWKPTGGRPGRWGSEPPLDDGTGQRRSAFAEAMKYSPNNPDLQDDDDDEENSKLHDWAIGNTIIGRVLKIFGR